MNYEQVKEKVLDLISRGTSGIGTEKCLPHEIEMTDTLRDSLGYDSFDTLELIFNLEREFRIAIPDDNIDALSDATVEYVINYVWEKVR